jgi:UPF0176 protein
MPEEDQKALRKGLQNSNKIFKKGRSEKLIFKVSREKPLSFPHAIKIENSDS